MGVEVKATYKPKLTYRVWRESEQRWYTDRQLRREALWNRLTRLVVKRNGRD